MKPHNRKILSSQFSMRLEFLFPSIPPPLPTLTSPKPTTTTPPPALHSILAISILAVITALIVTGFFFLLYLRRRPGNPIEAFLRRRLQLRPTSSSQEAPSKGADAAVVGSLPVFGYDENEKIAGNVDCAICLCEFDLKESVKKISSCGHVFHPQCIELWLLSHSSCPLCRSTQLC